jgi:hypothetical protein
MNPLIIDRETQIMPPAQEVLDFLLSRPTPEQIVDFKSSPVTQARLEELLEKNREGHLNEEETFELDMYQQVNHFFILLKARAHSAVLSKNN